MKISRLLMILFCCCFIGCSNYGAEIILNENPGKDDMTIVENEMNFHDEGEQIAVFTDEKTLVINGETNNGVFPQINGYDYQENIVIKNVETVPENAFAGNQVIKCVTFENVQVIADNAFYKCTNLEKSNFPDGLKTIGDMAFWGTALKEVTFPESLLRIGFHAFTNCDELERVLFPTKMETVETGFWNCPKLRSIRLPAEMETLASETFAFCHGIVEFTVPKGIHTLGDGVAHDSSIKRIIFEGRLRAIVRLLSEEYPDLQQLVFLDGPPLQEDVLSEYAEDELWDGIVGCESVTVYYFREKDNLWAPNGETEWNGFPLVGIDSLDDLPPLTETTSMSLYHGGIG